jgi:solute carrier family 25 (mitochondrial citrate transporter), member 1
MICAILKRGKIKKGVKLNFYLLYNIIKMFSDYKHLLAGASAGLAEVSLCHPLDTIKTRLQLSYKNQNTIDIVKRIVQKESFMSLYKGYTAVTLGIIPKTAFRFSSFNYTKNHLHKNSNLETNKINFISGFSSGVLEAILIMNPVEVCKIKMQAQTHSLSEPREKKIYTNVFQTGHSILKNEGVIGLYRGLLPTVIRQSSNQSINFTVYYYLKKNLNNYQDSEVKAYQKFLLGVTSSSISPLLNTPIDTAKTRLQNQSSNINNLSNKQYTGLFDCIQKIYKYEGYRSLWKGCFPRILRLAPGQGISFTTYEYVISKLEDE